MKPDNLLRAPKCVFCCFGEVVEDMLTKICGDIPGGQWLRICLCNAGDTGLIPGQGTKIPYAEEQLRQNTATTEAL